MGSRLLKLKSSNIFLVILLLFVFILVSSQAQAGVSGTCANCHIMHNSQDGDAVDASGPNEYLLAGGAEATTCLSCHSAASGATWKDPVTQAPIVWNQSEPTFNSQKGLAGGNFYWVGAGDDTKGHNVYGIAGVDGNIGSNPAPGKHTNATCSSDSCHYTLAQPPSYYIFGNGGCEGCHTKVSHHNDSNGWYRFLKGHGNEASNDYVVGVEDDDWEFETATDHNWYKGTTAVYNNGALVNQNTITSFCSGCHGAFHGPLTAGEGMGSDSPWVRHPTDIQLPTDGEYAGYDPVTNYSTEAPVAWVNPGTPDRDEAIVMCLSCHRPHGSAYKDLLRWDYVNMVAGTTGGSAGTGCFTCHTGKDGL